MLCVNDSNFKVRRLAIFTVLKLIPFQPKLLPKVKHLLFKILLSLNQPQKLFSQTKIENLWDLNLFVQYAPFLIKEKLPLMMDFLLIHLEDLSRKKVRTVVEILGTVGRLTKLDSSTAQANFDRISFKCVEILETRNSCFYKCVFSCLTQLLRATGFQMILMFR